MDKENLQRLFEKYCKKLRITPGWDVQLQFVEDPAWRKTGDFKIDCTDHKAILMHIKMYPLDQVTESLITSHFEEGTPAWDFAYRQFFTALEITVEELAKCFLLEFGEDRAVSYGRCAREKSFNELYDGLKNIE